MSTYKTFGPLGLIILAFGLLAGLLSGNWTSFYVLTHLILGGMMVSLYLFTQLDNLKEAVGGRQAKYGTNAAVYTVLTLAVICVVNYLAVQHPQRWDLTEQGIFSLAPQSRQLVEGLEADVTARAFFREGEAGTATDLLESYAAVSDRFSWELIDPDKRPELAEQYEIDQYGTVHLSVGDDSAKVTEVSEEQLTNTLIRLTAATRRLAYYVVGHGEPDPEDSSSDLGWGRAAAALENEGYEVEPLVLGSVPDVPGDADLLIVAGPQRPFLERELQSIERYLDRGGKAMVMLDPQQGGELRPLLAERGIEMADNVVIEEFVQLFAGSQLGVEPIIGDYGSHPITQGFGQRTIFRLARTVSPIEETPEGITVDPLARTSPSSWAETDLEALFDTGEVGLDEEDTEGPVSIAVAATLSAEALSWTAPAIATARGEDAEGTSDGEAEPDAEEAEAPEGAADETDEAPSDLEGRVVVVGDSDWLTNRMISLYYNEDLFLNAVGWLAGEEELISIRPRRTRASRVMLTQSESQAVFYTTVLLLPELILFIGMMIWLGRRNR